MELLLLVHILKETRMNSSKRIYQIGDKIVYYGDFKYKSAFLRYLKGEKIIRWWVGTDALMLEYFPPGIPKWFVLSWRLKCWCAQFYISENWHGCHAVRKNLIYFFKSIDLYYKQYPDLYPKPIKKKPLVVLIHDPSRIYKYEQYGRWKFGIDIIDQVKKRTGKWCYFITVDNTQDMNVIFPLVDCCLLPKRLKGNPRLVSECKINNIPVYYDTSASVDSCLDFLTDVRLGGKE